MLSPLSGGERGGGKGEGGRGKSPYKTQRSTPRINARMMVITLYVPSQDQGQDQSRARYSGKQIQIVHKITAEEKKEGRGSGSGSGSGQLGKHTSHEPRAEPLSWRST